MKHLFAMLACVCAVGQDIEIHEEMRVLQYVMDVRVLDAKGQPILGLKPEDFRLRNRGKDVKVDTVRWVDQTAPRPQKVRPTEERFKTLPDVEGFQEIPDRVRTSSGFIDTSIDYLPTRKENVQRSDEDEQDKIDGRFIIFFVQNDIGSSRNQGLVHMIHHGKKVVDRLAPNDWVAVFSFDSHLKMHLDFTRDREAAREAIGRCLTKVKGRILFGGAPPSIADEIDIDEAEDAADMETALTIVGRAVEHLPGEKIVAYLGWGFGSMDAMGIKTNRRYDTMLDTLFASDVAVFSLDMTMAEYHSLEATLKRIARDTGGLYERTANHPEASVTRFLSAIQGYYVVSFTLPGEGLKPELKVTIKDRRKARVTFSKDYNAFSPVKSLYTRGGRRR